MTKRAWQGTACKVGRCVGLAGLAMVFGGAAAIIGNQVYTDEKTGKNEYEIAGFKAAAPNEFQAKAMMVSLAGGPVTFLGLVSLAVGGLPLPEKKKDKGGPSPK